MTYEITYRGPYATSVQAMIERWCADHECVVQRTPLLDGERFTILGSPETVRQAPRQAREWFRGRPVHAPAACAAAASA